jgi:chromosomal replication initiator protein
LLKFMRSSQPAICRGWFDQLEPLGIAGGVLRVRAHSNVHRDYLQRACAAPFNDAAQTATGRLISVRFLGPEDELDAATGAIKAVPTQPTPVVVQRPMIAGVPQPLPATMATAVTANAGAIIHEPPVEGSPEAMRGATERIFNEPLPGPARVSVMDNIEHLYDDGLVLNPDYAFDNFVAGPNNRLALAAAIAVSSNPGAGYNPFFVHGGVGLGKTHLLQAICLGIRAARPNAVIYYTSCEGFTTQFMDAVQAGAMNRFRYKFRHVDVLVVDDIHFLAKRDRTQEEFFHTFNALHQNHKHIVLASDAPPEEIPDLEERLVSRFKWGLVTEITPPDYETRIQILLSKARMRGLELDKDVAAAIAQRLESNIRELEGAVTNLQMMAQVEKRPIDLELVRMLLGKVEKKTETTISIQTIISSVTEFYGVKPPDLQSKRRQRSIALPRQLCMYLARRNTRFSLEEIGGYFGGRDHTTVMHAVRTIEGRMSTDSEFSQQVNALEGRLRGTPVM